MKENEKINTVLIRSIFFSHKPMYNPKKIEETVMNATVSSPASPIRKSCFPWVLVTG